MELSLIVIWWQIYYHFEGTVFSLSLYGTPCVIIIVTSSFCDKKWIIGNKEMPLLCKFHDVKCIISIREVAYLGGFTISSNLFKVDSIIQNVFCLKWTVLSSSLKTFDGDKWTIAIKTIYLLRNSMMNKVLSANGDLITRNRCQEIIWNSWFDFAIFS